MMQRIAKNIFSLAFSRIASGVILFFVYIRLVTYLGPTEFGRFALVVAYYTIFSLLVDLGISRYVIKKVSEDKSLAGQYLGNFFISQFFISLGILLFFLLVPILAGYDSEVRRGMLLAGAGLFALSVSIPFASVLQAWQKIHLVAVVNFFNTIGNAAWLVVGMVFHKSFVFMFWLYIWIGIFDLVVYFILTRKFVKPDFSFQGGLFKKMLLYGIPFAFISGFEILISKIDVVIQKFYLPYSQVGLYSSAYRFLDFLTFVPAVLAISLFPYFASHADLDNSEVRTVANNYNRYMAILAVPLGVGATILADKIVLSLFDARYLGAVLPFQILIWSTVLTLIYAVPNAMMLVKKARLTAVILSLITLFNVAANLILIPRYGILASAWITVISYAFGAIAYIAYAKRLVSFDMLNFFPWPVVASLVMGVFLWWQKTNFNLLALVGFGIVLYFAVLAVAGFIGRRDADFLLSIFTSKDQ